LGAKVDKPDPSEGERNNKKEKKVELGEISIEHKRDTVKVGRKGIARRKDKGNKETLKPEEGNRDRCSRSTG